MVVSIWKVIGEYFDTPWTGMNKRTQAYVGVLSPGGKHRSSWIVTAQSVVLYLIIATYVRLVATSAPTPAVF